MQIAFLGTGLMGAPMVRNLAAAGHDLHIWNRSPEKAQALSGFAKVYDHAIEAVNGADIVITMLSDGPVTEYLLREQGVMAAAPADAIFINMGSVEPECDRNLSQLALSQAKHYLDAPVSGGVHGAEEATLTILVGGNKAVMDVVESVLTVMGTPHYLGRAGSGQVAKLANQMIVAITIGAVAESFKLAESAGCDPALLRTALRGGFADSKILELHGKRMVDRDFKPGGRSSIQLKDLHNVLSLAAESNLDLPMTVQAKDAFTDLVEQHNGGDLDHSAYYLWLERKAKI